MSVTIPRRALGKTGIEVTQLGYGSMGLRGPNTWGVRVVSDAQSEAFLHRVLDSGINLIDTAPDYGASEDRIGRFLSARRNEYVLATKCGCDYVQHSDSLEIRHTWTADVIHRNVESSLKRLRTDHIDIMQFHGGEAETLQSAGLLDVVRAYREQGVIRLIGVSTSLPQLPAMVEMNVFDTFQIPYSILAPEHSQWISRAAETGAGIIIRGGVAQGGPDAEIQRPALHDVWTRAKLDELLPPDMTRAQFILRYTLAHPDCHCTIVGTCNPSHLDENLAAAKAGPLPKSLCAAASERCSRVSA